MTRKWAIAASLIVAMSANPALLAGPLERTLTGFVRDLSGNPIAGARVSDGWRSVFTDQTGEYALYFHDLQRLSDYRITASKTEFDTRSESWNSLIGPDELDFELPYWLFRKLSPAYTNGPATIAFELESRAPADTEVRVTNSALGLSQQLEHIGLGPSGRNKWTGEYTVPGDTKDGTYDVIFTARSGESDVGDPVRHAFTLDRVSPILSNPKVEPSSGTLTTASSKPEISVQVQEARSGIDYQQSQSVEIKDSNGALVASGSAVHRRETSGYPFLKTHADRAAFIPSDDLGVGRYSAHFTITDRAGNTSLFEFEFEVIQD